MYRSKQMVKKLDIMNWLKARGRVESFEEKIMNDIPETERLYRAREQKNKEGAPIITVPVG